MQVAGSVWRLRSSWGSFWSRSGGELQHVQQAGGDASISSCSRHRPRRVRAQCRSRVRARALLPGSRLLDAGFGEGGEDGGKLKGRGRPALDLVRNEKGSGGGCCAAEAVEGLRRPEGERREAGCGWECGTAPPAPPQGLEEEGDGGWGWRLAVGFGDGERRELKP